MIDTIIKALKAKKNVALKRVIVKHYPTGQVVVLNKNTLVARINDYGTSVRIYNYSMTDETTIQCMNAFIKFLGFDHEVLKQGNELVIKECIKYLMNNGMVHKEYYIKPFDSELTINGVGII